MAPGFNRMNRITVQLASQGVAEYLRQAGARSAVIGCDHRHNSRQFAEVAGRCLRRAGIKILNFSHVVPTPFVPFAVQRERADFGIMITASHNPAADNGYKVYGGNACQIVSPMDREISKLIAAQDYHLWDLEGEEEEESKDIYAQTLEAYLQSNLQLFAPLLKAAAAPDSSTAAPRSVVYTPMHGVGWSVVEPLFHRLGQPASSSLLPVASQLEPDPDFPTVAFPNPEEGRGALLEAISTATKAGIRTIFANDPDADRFNCAELQDHEGGWHIFTGNEIALILADHLWRHRGLLFPDAREFSMVRSCVSSRQLCAMGGKEGFQVVETLTGFKHLSNAAQKLEQASVGGQSSHHKVLLAYEEAIGYMVNTAVWDKDGISALLLMKIVVDQLQSRGRTLREHLTDLCRQYGYFAQYNSYYFCQPASRSAAVFQRLRQKLCTLLRGEAAADGEGLSGLGGASLRLPALADEVRIEGVRDYPGTSMITLYLDKEHLSWLTLRASGTEPKIKFYSELCCDYSERTAVNTSLHARIDALCEWLLEPNTHNLKRRDP